MDNLFSIEGRVIVITGGTGVLGSRIGRYLAGQGATVVLIGRNAERGNALADEIRGEGGNAHFISADVLDAAAVEAAAETVVARWGRVDALLNAAGGNMPGATIGPEGSFFDIDIEDFRKVLDLNLTGTLIPTRAFLRPMVKAGRGVIVNFSSMAAFRPLTRVMGYGAAKAAVSNLTAFLATEVATKFSKDIRVNAIAPGFFLTEQNRTLLTNTDGSLTQRGSDIISHTPFGRFGSADELCGTIHYLVSDASAFVTGTVAVVDGGFNAFAI